MKANWIRFFLSAILFRILLGFGPMMACGGGSTPPPVIVPVYNLVNPVATDFLLDSIVLSSSHDTDSEKGHEILIYDASDTTLLACIGRLQSTVMGNPEYYAYVGLKDAFIASQSTVIEGNTALNLKLVKKTDGTGYCQATDLESDIIESAQDIVLGEASLTLNELIAAPHEIGTITIQVRMNDAEPVSIDVPESDNTGVLTIHEISVTYVASQTSFNDNEGTTPDVAVFFTVANQTEVLGCAQLYPVDESIYGYSLLAANFLNSAGQNVLADSLTNGTLYTFFVVDTDSALNCADSDYLVMGEYDTLAVSEDVNIDTILGGQIPFLEDEGYIILFEN